MILTRLSLSNRVAVVVGGILIVIFGALSLGRLPIQLAPSVERPEISISTNWRAAAPQEVESEILEPQEDVLRGLPGMRRLTSTAGQGQANINIEYDINTDMTRAMIEVINRLNQVPRYPVDANEPTISLGNGDRGNAIAWYAIQPVDGNERDIVTYQDFVDEVIRPRFERIPGVARSTAFGGRAYEVRITFDPYHAASLGVDLSAVGADVGGNQDISAGFSEVGRRQYTIRFAGKLDVADLGDLVLEWRDGRAIRLRDVATVELRLQDRSGVFSQNAGPSIAVNVIPESGANVLDIKASLDQTVAELKETELTPRGLEISQSYDASVYITQAIDMVRNNLLLGMLLAVGVLWWFLRKLRATLIVGLAIPLCLLVSFMVMDGLGRTLNIISLAGLAFATGMVLDAAIVVLENIVRHREQGRNAQEAAMRGVQQVWGALIASTATTVAIFLPVVFLRNEAGQLFSDLAITISAAVVASLLVAVTVLPAAAQRLLGQANMVDRNDHWWSRITGGVMRLTETPRRRLFWIAGLTLGPLLIGALIMPSADYLPEGRRNFVFGFVVTPPGMSVDTAKSEITDVINDRLRPYLEGEKEPHIANTFLGYFGNGAFIGARTINDQDVDAMIGVMNREILQGFPDSFGGVSRRPIFGGRGGRRVDVDLSSADYDQLLIAARSGFGALQAAFPTGQVRPQPSLELAEPELRLIPDDRRIAEVGWNRTRMATVIRALGDGAFVGEYFDGNRRLNIVLRSDPWQTPEELAAVPLATPSGEIQTVGELTRMIRTAGPTEIRRVDRRRTVTLQLTPPSGMPMEEVLAVIDEQVVPVLRGALPDDGAIAFRGTAEALGEALQSMTGSFLLAMVILYLLISALFQSFKDSLLVITTIPMATVGGVAVLQLINLFTPQPLDLMTMIGFVILLGLVVNNAILLVYRARQGEQEEGLDRRQAVETAVRLRLRPILMSTLTSIFGMLPLLLMPGSGSELYRGLAAVIVGGMLVSTLFTLILLPSLLRIGETRQDPVISAEEVPA
ncbi:MAG: efflux RND transporter permease subunit [Wenzhouxiangellaceae bacterium]